MITKGKTELLVQNPVSCHSATNPNCTVSALKARPLGTNPAAERRYCNTVCVSVVTLLQNASYTPHLSVPS
jgi:hypothetical protein